MPDIAPDLLTVADAAKRFHLSERTISRLVKAAGTQARPEQVQRQTKSGTRIATVYPAGIIAGLIQSEKDSGKSYAPRAAKTPAPVSSRRNATEAKTPAGTTLAGVVAGTVPRVFPAPGTVSDPVDTIAADLADWQRRAEVAEARAQLLERERDTLQGVATRAQENERTALAELSAARESFAREIAEVRRESAVMIAATVTGRIMPYGASDAHGTGDTVVSPLTTTPPPAPNPTGQAPTGPDAPRPGTAEGEAFPVGTTMGTDDYPAQDNATITPEEKRSFVPRRSPRWFEFWRKKEG